MKQDRNEEGRFSHKGHGLGTVTEEMVMRRARELAQINGRPASKVLDADIEQARRELTGEEGLYSQSSPEEALPEDARWDENPASEGERTPAVPAPDEQTFSEKLVNEGLEDAEQDRMIKGTQDRIRKDQQGED